MTNESNCLGVCLPELLNSALVLTYTRNLRWFYRFNFEMDAFYEQRRSRVCGNAISGTCLSTRV